MKQFSLKMPLVEIPLEENGPVIHRSPDFSDISALSEAGEHGGLAGRMEAALERMSEREQPPPRPQRGWHRQHYLIP